jgi:hypothetical protein
MKKKIYKITLPSGEIMHIGSGISNIMPSHEGVPAKDFAKALAKAAKAVSDAGIFDSDNDSYGHKCSAR